jgi:hypothetical protein
MMRGGSFKDVQGLLGCLIVTMTLRCSHPDKTQNKSRKPVNGQTAQGAKYLNSEKMADHSTN